jgi:carbon monoxide dehydrogenase subunit G
MGLNWAEQSVEIAAPPEACFDAIVDYETFPDWQNAVASTEVIERYDDGLGKIVELQVDAKIRVVTYRLHYHYERPAKVWWDFVEGEGLKDVTGDYLFEPRDGATLATYKLGVDVGIPVPGMIYRRLNEGVMRRSVQDLKAEVERRLAG